MAFSGNNQALYNAAFNGCMAGALAGRPVADATQADYNGIAAAATAVATKVDSLIVADATLTTAGATLVPASAANQANALAKPALLRDLCFGAFFQRYNVDATAADYATIGAAIAAAYAAGVAAYANAPGGTSLS